MPDLIPSRLVFRPLLLALVGLALAATAGAQSEDLPLRDLGPPLERKLPVWAGSEFAPRHPAGQPALEDEAERLWNERRARLSSDPDQADVLLDVLVERALGAGQRELAPYAAALIREAGEASGRGDLATAEHRLKQARRLAPDLPHTYLAEAALFFRKGPAHWPDAVGSLVDAVRTTAGAPVARTRAVVNAGIVGVVAVSLLSILLPISMLLRYRRGVGHLLDHLKPEWLARSVQMLGVAVGLGFVARLDLGVGWIACALFLPAWLAASRREQVLLGLVALALAAIPALLPKLAAELEYLDGLHDDPVVRAQREALSPGLVDALAEEIGRAADPREAIAALALVQKRGGQLAIAEAAYRHVLEQGLDEGWVRTNLGNVLLNLRLSASEGAAQDGLRDEGMAEYDRAIALDPGLAEPWFNKSQLWREEYDLVRSYPAFEEAQRLDPDGINSFYVTAAPTLNRMLMDAPLPEARLARRLAPDPDARAARARGLSVIFMRGLPPAAAAIAIVLMLVVAMMAVAGVRESPIVPSGCARCGAPLCSLCDGGTGAATECEACLSLAIGNPILDPVFKQDRRRAIDRSRVRSRWLSIVASLLVPGAGHIQIGLPVLGFLWLSLAVLLVSLIVLGGGLIAPRALVWAAHGGLFPLWVGMLIATYLLANLSLARGLRRAAD